MLLSTSLPKYKQTIQNHKTTARRVLMDTKESARALLFQKGVPEKRWLCISSDEYGDASLSYHLPNTTAAELRTAQKNAQIPKRAKTINGIRFYRPNRYEKHGKDYFVSTK